MERIVGVAMTLGVWGCTTSAAPLIAPEEARAATAPPPSSSASHASPTASSADGARKGHPGAFAPRASAPSPAPLGAACERVATTCGKFGRVAVVRKNLRTHGGDDPPCAGIQTSPNSGPNLVRACLDGERIFVSSVCIHCRISVEERLLGLLSEMTPEQLRTAQQLAYLPEDPLLTTTSAWKSAIDAAARRVTVNGF